MISHGILCSTSMIAEVDTYVAVLFSCIDILLSYYCHSIELIRSIDSFRQVYGVWYITEMGTLGNKVCVWKYEQRDGKEYTDLKYHEFAKALCVYIISFFAFSFFQCINVCHTQPSLNNKPQIREKTTEQKRNHNFASLPHVSFNFWHPVPLETLLVHNCVFVSLLNEMEFWDRGAAGKFDRANEVLMPDLRLSGNCWLIDMYW